MTLPEAPQPCDDPYCAACMAVRYGHRQDVAAYQVHVDHKVWKLPDVATREEFVDEMIVKLQEMERTWS